MKQLLAFDLDGTLAEIGEEMLPENVDRLRLLEASGYRIAIVSGKPVDYLCGFARQLGLNQPVLVGENSAVIQIGVDLPPSDFYILPYSQEAKQSIAYIRTKINALLPHIWYQPNLVALTPFPKNQAEFDIIADCLQKNKPYLKDVRVYRHADSFDIVPCSVNKYNGMAYLGKILGIPSENVIAIGDGVNDYPMFDYAGYAIGVRVAQEDKVDINFPDIAQVLAYLLG